MDNITLYSDDAQTIELDRFFHLYLRETIIKKIKIDSFRTKFIAEKILDILSKEDGFEMDKYNITKIHLSQSHPMLEYQKGIAIQDTMSIFNLCIERLSEISYDDIKDKEIFREAATNLKKEYKDLEIDLYLGLFDEQVDNFLGYMVALKDSELYILYFGYYIDEFLGDDY